MKNVAMIFGLSVLIFSSCSSCKKIDNDNNSASKEISKTDLLSKMNQLPQGAVQINVIIIEDEGNIRTNKVNASIEKILRQGPGAPIVNIGDIITIQYSENQDISVVNDKSKILVRKLESGKGISNNNWQLMSIE